MEVRGIDAFKRYIVESTEAGLRAVESYLVRELRTAVSVPNPTHKQVKYKYKKTKSGRAATHTIFEHGAPTGGPPWTRTTQGLHAIASEVLDGGTRLVIGVRSNAKYMLMLDAGIDYKNAGAGLRRTAYAKAVKSGRTKAAEAIARRAMQAAMSHDSGGKRQWPWAGVTVERHWATIEQLLRTGFR